MIFPVSCITSMMYSTVTRNNYDNSVEENENIKCNKSHKPYILTQDDWERCRKELKEYENNKRQELQNLNLYMSLC